MNNQLQNIMPSALVADPEISSRGGSSQSVGQKSPSQVQGQSHGRCFGAKPPAADSNFWN